MSTARRKKTTLDDELAGVRAAATDPGSADSATRLRAGLASRRAHVVALAAGIVKDRCLDGYGRDLRDAWTRFLGPPIEDDRRCHAKLALIEALDYTESRDPEPFLAAVRCVQLEPGFPKAVDTACGVRSRALLGLARIGHPDFVLVAGELLGDPEAPVRSAAATALVHFGDRQGAAALLLKLGIPDDDPLVTLACMGALLSLAPEHAMRRLAPLLTGDDHDERELAAMALGESGRDDAARLLIERLHECVTSKQREVFLRALGLHRSDRAADALVERIASRNHVDAAAAVAALAPRRFEAAIRARVEAAIGDRRALRAVYDEAFSDAVARDGRE